MTRLTSHIEKLALETFSVVLGIALQYLPFDLVIGLSRAYAYQQQIADANRGLLTAVYTPAFATGGVEAIAAMYSFLDDLASNEEHLRQQLDAEVPRTKQYCRMQ